MKLGLMNARALGVVCVAVGGGDTLLRMTGLTASGEPLGLLAILGLGLLSGYAPTERPTVWMIVLFSGLTFGWALVCMMVMLAKHPPAFLSPVVLTGYLAGSAALVYWGWRLLKRMNTTQGPTNRGERAVKMGAALAQGVRRWLQ